MEQSARSSTAQVTSCSSHPSSSSYTTAEEDPHNTSNIALNVDHLPESILTMADTPSTVRHLQSRIKLLEEILDGKEKVLLALSAELDAARDVSGVDASIGPLPLDPDADYKVHLTEYLLKLQEHVTAIARRDEIILKLECALKQRVADQETQNKQVIYLTDLVQCLKTQLHTVGQHLQEPQKKLLVSLKEKEQELQRKTAELTQCKAQSADEVQSLMHSLEQLQQREMKAFMTSKTSDQTSNQLAKEIDDLRQYYDSEIRQLQSEVEQARKVESALNSKLAKSQQECRKLTSDVSCMQLTHDAEVSSLKEELQRTIQQFKKECEGLREEARSSQEQLHKSLSQSSVLQAEINTLNLQLTEEKKLCKKLKNDLQLLQTEYSSEVSSHQKVVEHYKDQLQSLRLQFTDTLAEKHASHSAEIALLQGQIVQIKQAHEEVLKSLHHQIEEREQNSNKELQLLKVSCENDMKATRQELEHLKKDLKEKTSLILSQEIQIGSLDQKLSSEHQWGLAYKEQIHALSQKSNDDKNEISSFKHKIVVLEEQLANIQESSTFHIQKIEMLEKQLEDKQCELKETERQLEIFQKQFISEQEHGLSCKEQIDHISNKLMEYQHQNNVLQQNLTEKDTHYQNALSVVEEERSRNLELKSETDSLIKQLKQEQELSSSLKEKIDALNCQLKELVLEQPSHAEIFSPSLSVNKLTCTNNLTSTETDAHLNLSAKEAKPLHRDLKAVQATLNEERQLKDFYAQKCQELEIMLSENQRQINSKLSESSCESCKSGAVIHFPIRKAKENENLVTHLASSDPMLLTALCNSEGLNCGEQHDSSPNSGISSLQQDASSSPKAEKKPLGLESLQGLCHSYKGKIDMLEQELKCMTESNSLLKEQNKKYENQLNRLQTDYNKCKTDFQEGLGNLQKDISLKEGELADLVKSGIAKQSIKSEIHSYNIQVQELLSTKSSLEDKLEKCQEKYEKEITSYKEKVIALEQKLQLNSEQLKYDTVSALVEKCHCDLQVFKELYLLHEEKNKMLMKNDNQRNDEIVGYEALDQSSNNDSLNLPKPCEHNQLIEKLWRYRLLGIQYLEKLLQICDESLSKQLGSEEMLALHLSKSNILVEKLQIQLEEVSERSDYFSQECEKFKAYCKVLENKIKDSYTAIGGEKENSNLCSDPSNCAQPSNTFHWVHLYRELEQRNESLLMELHLSQLKVVELETKLSSSLVNQKDLRKDVQKRWEENIVKELDNSQEQWQMLQSKVECLCTEFSNKEYCCVEKEKKVIKENIPYDYVEVENVQAKMKPILDATSKSCKILLLEDKMRILELQHQIDAHITDKQSLEIKRLLTCLEESWQENVALQSELHNACQEVSVSRARINRVESFYRSQKDRSKTLEPVLEKIIDNLESAPLSSSTANAEHDLKSNTKLPLLDQIEICDKIVNKMMAECESLLSKLQDEENHVTTSGYFQSEALKLRRLHTSLQDIRAVLVNRSGPVMQVHVDLLTYQLAEKQSLYEDSCNSLYALEAELRNMEDQKIQCEEKLLGELSKHKIAARYWRLKSEAAQNLDSIKQNPKPDISENLLKFISQLNALYSKNSSEMCAEFERTVCMHEDRMKAQMAEQISALESRHKQQLSDLTEHLKGEHSWRDLEELHKQEFAAATAAHEYHTLKEVLEIRRQLTTSLNPLKFNPVSIMELTLQLMKYDLTSRFKAAVRKLALNVYNDWEKQMSAFETCLESVCTNQDQPIEMSCNADEVSHVEKIINDVSLLCEKLECMYPTMLQSLLCSVEKEFNLVYKKLEEMDENLQDAVNVTVLQEQLRKSEEKHRLAIESLTARHTAEETRLRLMLSSAEVTKTGDTNESSLIALRRELEEKHKHEMEDLRTYFEQKCADFEKHYSEEVFSQHSRKMSDCSSASESEIVSEMYYAGPGSASNTGPTVQSHMCDSLGESSFKDFEEQTQTIDLEKLLQDSREELEAMRLALESRHQGELEAQREVYEAKVEELLRTMGDSHTAELRLQSKKLEELQEMEKVLKNQLTSAEEEIKSLKDNFEALGCNCVVSQSMKNNHSCEGECKVHQQVQLMTDALKKVENESSAQIATLKVKLRDNCESLCKLEKEISYLKSKHEEELISMKNILSGRDLKIEELSRKVLEYQVNEEKWRELVNEKDAEKEHMLVEQRTELLTQHELLSKEKDEKNKLAFSELQENYFKLLKDQKASLDAEYSEYLDFVKKCADDTKMELIQNHEREMKELKCRYKQQLAEISSASEKKLPQEHSALEHLAKSPVSLEKLLQNQSWIDEIPRDCYDDLLKMSEELERVHKSEIETLIAKHQRDLSLKETEHEARIDSVRKECERRYHLQLEEVRTDIVQALEHHIQQLLNDDNDGSERPQELQQLEKKLAFKYQTKIDEIHEEHNRQVADIQKKHAAELEMIRKSISTSIVSAEELKHLHKERDCLRNVAASLRDVVAELVRYFMTCEDELNSTLMNELAKFETGHDHELLSITNYEANSTIGEENTSILQDTSAKEDLSVIIATPTRGSRFSALPKRVRFAPDVSSLLSFIDDDSIFESVGLGANMRDASLNFYQELDRCLDRLRCESAALLEISKPPSVIPALPAGPEQNEEDTTRSQLEEMRRSKVQLSSRLSNCQRSLRQLQQDNDELQAELDTLRHERDRLLAELQRLAQLEREPRQQTELVAEGYGEGEGDDSISSSSPRATSVEELQDKARTLLLGTNNGVLSPNASQQLPLVVEELCRDWERLAEEARRKQEDLQQQIEAADKQLRSTRAFLDEQATEREQERDDFMREIQCLKDQLRDKDRERSTHQQINQELVGGDCTLQLHLDKSANVEALENQLRDSQAALQDALSKVEKLDADQKQAVEKIWTLREIISDLELQLASKAEEAATIQTQNDSFQQLLEQQGRTQFELAQEMEFLQHSSGNEALSNRICELEEELRKLRLQAEQFGDLTAVQQMKSQLCNLEVSMESRTKEMECAHASTAAAVSPCLSSPSEDVSIRETLEAMRAAAGDKPSLRANSPITLPIDEVTRLEDQWQRHIRMDDAVLKRVRDLCMHFDDIQAEKDALSKRLQEQMHQVSSLEAKLDEHRCKFESKQVEATAPLRSQIEDLEAEVHRYVETLEIKERKIKTLESALQQAELSLNKHDAKFRKNSLAEHNAKVQLQHQISKLSAEKDKLQAVLNEKHKLDSSLPVLVESMLADKNADIDRLEKQVLELTRQVEFGSKYIASPSTTMEFEYREQEKLRAHVELSPVLKLQRSFSATVTLEETDIKNTSPGMEVCPPLLMESPSLMFDVPSPKLPLEVDPKHIPEDDSEVTKSNNRSVPYAASSLTVSNADSLFECQKLVDSLNHNIEVKEKELTDCLTRLSEKSELVAKLEAKCKYLEECESKLSEMSSLEKELKAVKEDLLRTVTSVNSDKDFFEAQLKSKDAELLLMKDELCASQTLIVNLQRKVQEAKQIAVSPKRPSPSTDSTHHKMQTDLETSHQENRQLKEKLAAMKVEMERQHERDSAEFEKLQETAKSVHETTSRLKEMELELIKANEELKIKQDIIEKTQNEVKHLNVECITLKEQLKIPVSEAASLASKLDAEKKFSKALQEELSMFKSKADDIELECQDLKKKITEAEDSLHEGNKIANIMEENKSFRNEITQMKGYIEEVVADRNRLIEHTKELEEEVLRLKAVNNDVEKILLDKTKVLQKYYVLETSKDELQKLLHDRTAEVKEIAIANENLSKELYLLRNALRNLDHQNEFPGLTNEDYFLIRDVQKQIGCVALRRGRIDAHQRLAASETDVYEIRPDSSQFSDSGSLDDLTGMVQQELDLSAQLDDTLLQSLDPLTKQKVTAKSSSKLVAALPPVISGNSENDARLEVLNASPQNQCIGLDAGQLQNQLITLQAELNKEKQFAQVLQKQVESLLAQYGALQKQDSDLIEDLRIKLSNALDTEKELRLQLHFELNKLHSPIHPVCTPRFSDKSVGTSAPPSLDFTSALQDQLRAAIIELEDTKKKKDAAEKQMRRLQEAEVRRSRRRAVNEEQYRGQIDQLKAKLVEKQQEYMTLRQQLSKVTEELELTRQELLKEREAHLVGNTPIVERLKMNDFLDELYEENRRMTKKMEQFNEERKILLAKNLHLEQQLHERQETAFGSNNQFHTVTSALTEAKFSTGSIIGIEDRINHLFGRYLRSDSYRKALVWQKRYLLSVISGFTESQNIAHNHLSSLISLQHPQQRHPQPRQKFRCVVFALIAIHRMHFMVDRWHRGKRIGCSAILTEAFVGESSQLPSLHGRPFTPPSCLAMSSMGRLQCNLSQSPPTLEKPRKPQGQSYTSQYSRIPSSDAAKNLSEYLKQYDASSRWFDDVISHPPK